MALEDKVQAKALPRKGNVEIRAIITNLVGLGFAAGSWAVAAASILYMLSKTPIGLDFASGGIALVLYIGVSVYELGAIEDWEGIIHSPFALILWITVVAIDLGACYKGIYDFFHGTQLTLVTFTLDFKSESVLNIVSLLLALWVAFSPEPLVRHYWEQLMK